MHIKSQPKSYIVCTHNWLHSSLLHYIGLGIVSQSKQSSPSLNQLNAAGLHANQLFFRLRQSDDARHPQPTSINAQKVMHGAAPQLSWSAASTCADMAEISTYAQFLQPLDWLLRIQNLAHVLSIWHSWAASCRRCASLCLECGHCLKKSWTDACVLSSSSVLAQVSPVALYLALHAANKACKLLLCCHHKCNCT